MELKLLTYLYLVQYSAQEPEQAIMVVNTFIQDSQDPNPLILALAVRTMCRIELESVAENMVIPLKKLLSDTDLYVRKTAAFSGVKLYDDLLRDDNSMVVSNTTAALFETNESRNTIDLLLNAVNASSEWCQIILFDALTRYQPNSLDDLRFFIDRFIPFLKHGNPAVVIGSFRCIVLFMDQDETTTAKLFLHSSHL
jgi:vesicle coat complex subunit